MTPRISIIIPTLNREEDLNATIGYIMMQSFQNYEILIIDQSKMPSEILLKDDRIKLFHCPSFQSASRARNMGLHYAIGKLVLFLDDDIILESSEYLSSVVRGFLKYNVAGITGPIIPIANRVLKSKRHNWSLNKKWGWLFFPRNYAFETKIADGGAGNLAVIRDNAIQIGGMDERFEKGAHREESDFNTRYTEKFGPYQFLPECALVHIGRRTGGVRSWDSIKSKVVKAQHHYDGAFYYLIKNVKLIYWLPHLLSLKIFFFKRRELLLRPDWLLTSIFRWIRGFFNGYRMYLKGPKYMDF